MEMHMSGLVNSPAALMGERRRSFGKSIAKL
jgi:hypothetical protein